MAVYSGEQQKGITLSQPGLVYAAQLLRVAAH